MKKKFFSFFNNEEGYVLVTALIVILVIMILGFAYVNMALSQTQQAERHNDQKQAYYYARSGSEKALVRLANGLEDAKNNDNNLDMNYFDSFSWNLKNENTNDIHKNDEINVNINLVNKDGVNDIEKIQDIKEIKINSIGKKDNITINKSANIKLIPPKNDFNIPPVGEYDDNPILAQDNGWVNGQSGIIDDTGGLILGDSEASVVFRGPGNSLKNKDEAIFKAKRFYFDDEDGKGNKDHPIQIEKGSKLELYSNEIVFYIDIELEGKLCLRTAEDNTDKRGFVYFGKDLELENETVKSGAYTFPNDGLCLPDGSGDLDPYKQDISKLNDWDIKWE
ncbi:MAG: hypothetical protein ACOCRX_02765 [Candidatus Woesearchaeota archaeon]